MYIDNTKMEMEKCVSCGVETTVPKNTHIDLRQYYIEGGGQLCNKCGKKLFDNE